MYFGALIVLWSPANVSPILWPQRYLVRGVHRFLTTTAPRQPRGTERPGQTGRLRRRAHLGRWQERCRHCRQPHQTWPQPAADSVTPSTLRSWRQRGRSRAKGTAAVRKRSPRRRRQLPPDRCVSAVGFTPHRIRAASHPTCGGRSRRSRRRGYPAGSAWRSAADRRLLAGSRWPRPGPRLR